MKQKFIEKGYPPDLLDQAQQFYNTDEIPESKTRISDNSGVRFVTQLHAKHWKMEGIFKQHWSILQQDPQLENTIPAVPQFAYRKVPNIKRKTAPSEIRSKKTSIKKQLTLTPPGWYVSV